jgi:hypothetical protein
MDEAVPKLKFWNSLIYIEDHHTVAQTCGLDHRLFPGHNGEARVL